jgi:hypothetical protein
VNKFANISLNLSKVSDTLLVRYHKAPTLLAPLSSKHKKDHSISPELPIEIRMTSSYVPVVHDKFPLRSMEAAFETRSNVDPEAFLSRQSSFLFSFEICVSEYVRTSLQIKAK